MRRILLMGLTLLSSSLVHASLCSSLANQIYADKSRYSATIANKQLPWMNLRWLKIQLGAAEVEEISPMQTQYKWVCPEETDTYVAVITDNNGNVTEVSGTYSNDEGAGMFSINVNPPPSRKLVIKPIPGQEIIEPEFQMQPVTVPVHHRAPSVIRPVIPVESELVKKTEIIKKPLLKKPVPAMTPAQVEALIKPAPAKPVKKLESQINHLLEPKHAVLPISKPIMQPVPNQQVMPEASKPLVLKKPELLIKKPEAPAKPLTPPAPVVTTPVMPEAPKPAPMPAAPIMPKPVAQPAAVKPIVQPKKPETAEPGIVDKAESLMKKLETWISPKPSMNQPVPVIKPNVMPQAAKPAPMPAAVKKPALPIKQPQISVPVIKPAPKPEPMMPEAPKPIVLEKPRLPIEKAKITPIITKSVIQPAAVKPAEQPKKPEAVIVKPVIQPAAVKPVEQLKKLEAPLPTEVKQQESLVQKLENWMKPEIKTSTIHEPKHAPLPIIKPAAMPAAQPAKKPAPVIAKPVLPPAAPVVAKPAAAPTVAPENPEAPMPALNKPELPIKTLKKPQLPMQTTIKTPIKSLPPAAPAAKQIKESCNDVMKQIYAVAQQGSVSGPAYPWEDLAWLQKNFGKTPMQHNNNISGYEWKCGGESIMYFVKGTQIIFGATQCGKDACTISYASRVNGGMKGFTAKVQPKK